MPLELVRRALSCLPGPTLLRAELACGVLRQALRDDDTVWRAVLARACCAPEYVNGHTLSVKQRVFVPRALARCRCACRDQGYDDTRRALFDVLRSERASRRDWLVALLCRWREREGDTESRCDTGCAPTLHAHKYPALDVSEQAVAHVLARALAKTLEVLRSALHVAVACRDAEYPVVRAADVRVAMHPDPHAKPRYDARAFCPYEEVMPRTWRRQARAARLLFSLACVPIYTGEAQAEALRFLHALICMLLSAASVAWSAAWDEQSLVLRRTHVDAAARAMGLPELADEAGEEEELRDCTTDEEAEEWEPNTDEEARWSESTSDSEESASEASEGEGAGEGAF